MIWNKSKKDEEAEKLKILLHLATEISTEIRSRREPEYTYTAATVGAIGAIIWGISALPKDHETFFQHPAFTGLILSLSIGISVICKICSEHKNYKSLLRQQKIIYQKITKLKNIDQCELPIQFRINFCPKSPGYRYSIRIVIAALIGAIIYCSILLSKTINFC